MPELARKASKFAFYDFQPSESDCREEILKGLKKPQKTINPKYFYDSNGSALFEKITQLAEYYPTRVERSILEQKKEEIAACCGDLCVLIEPGSGSSEKIRLLLESIKPQAYVPIDIAGEFLYESAECLAEAYPWLDIRAYCDDFATYDGSRYNLPFGRRVVFYPGSTIGNMTPENAVAFLNKIRHWMGVDGGLIIGVDLHKQETALNAAYNDKAGITALFNLNILDHVNSLLGADFHKENYDHLAFYNVGKRRIEMHLKSNRDHYVNISGESIAVIRGETIHTENSYKYTTESFGELAHQAGLQIEKSWLDEDKLFSVHFLTSAPTGIVS